MTKRDREYQKAGITNAMRKAAKRAKTQPGGMVDQAVSQPSDLVTVAISAQIQRQDHLIVSALSVSQADCDERPIW